MADLNELFKDTTLIGTILSSAVAFCIYLWKKYEKYVSKTARNLDRNYELIQNVKELVKDTSNISDKANDSVLHLQEHIEDLESRIRDLEKTDNSSQTNLAIIIKDIQTIKSYIESYNMMTFINNCNNNTKKNK